MSIINDKIYDINFFKEIEIDYDHNSDYNIDENIKKIIDNLIYDLEKTKSINNKIINVNNNIQKSDNFNKTNKNNNKKLESELNTDWKNNNTNKNFKTTTIIQDKDGINIHIINIKANLNKLTDKNYDDITLKINEIIDELLNINTCEEELYKIGNIIFEIATKNKFYSKLYADLFCNLIDKYPIMNTILQNNFNNYLNIFENIEIVDSTKDYDKFCKINKINEERLSLSMFLLNLTKNNIIKKEDLFNIVVKLFNNILNMLSDATKNHLINETMENFAILYDENIFKDFINNPIFDDNKSLYDMLNIISNSTLKDYEGLTLKTKFKIMSLVGK